MRIDSSMQTQLSNDRFDELCEAFDDLNVPLRHPDPAGFARDELGKAGFSDEELSAVELEVDPSGELMLWANGPDLLCEEIVKIVRWSPRRWRKVLDHLAGVAATIVDANGGMVNFAKRLGDAAFRREVVKNFGGIVEGIMVRIPLQRVTKPEQAALCVLSSNETHNQLGLLWQEGGSKRMNRRFWDLLEKHPPLLLFYLMKKADRGGRIELFAA